MVLLLVFKMTFEEQVLLSDIYNGDAESLKAMLMRKGVGLLWNVRATKSRVALVELYVNSLKYPGLNFTSIHVDCWKMSNSSHLCGYEENEIDNFFPKYDLREKIQTWRMDAFEGTVVIDRWDIDELPLWFVCEDGNVFFHKAFPADVLNV